MSKHKKIFHFFMILTLTLFIISAVGFAGEKASPSTPQQGAVSQAASPQISFRGSFYFEPAEKLDSNRENPISPSLVFMETSGGKRYAVYARFLFNVNASSRREYIVDGIPVKEYLPNRAKSADYRRIVESAWPDAPPEDLKYAAEIVEKWVKRNANKSLLLINSLRRAESTEMQNRQPIKVEGKVQYSKLIRRIEPVYPQAALRYRISGNVELLLTIDEDGIVEQVKAINGDPLLIPAALTAVRQWIYRPTLVNGEAVPVLTTVTVVFGLR